MTANDVRALKFRALPEAFPFLRMGQPFCFSLQNPVSQALCDTDLKAFLQMRLEPRSVA